MTEFIPTIQLSPDLQSLFAACETVCVAGCCGIDAFDFSPLRIAAYLTHSNTMISDTDIRQLEDELDSLLSQTESLEPDASGFICTIDGTNQLFTRETITELVRMIQRHVRLAPRVVAYSNQISQEND